MIIVAAMSLLAVLLPAAVVGSGSAAAVADSVASSPAAIAIGVEGSDGQLWVQAPQLGTGWHSLGGQIVGPPAVTAPPNPNGAAPTSPLFVATGTNKLLYMRGVTGTWQRVSPAAWPGYRRSWSAAPTGISIPGL